jgi:CPA1 family monovalent cation:H+ antiporter
MPYLGEQGAIVASFVAAFGSYLVGESIEASGVLAAVTAGLIYGRYLPTVGTAQFRLQTRTVWDQVVFIINGLVFMLIGLELQPVVEGIVGYSAWQLVWYAVAVCLAAILIRIVWVFGAGYVLRFLEGRVKLGRAAPSNATSAVVAWAGLRGVVTLAAALALPRLTISGEPFDDRNLIIFLAFAVIVATLLLQGLTLAPLVRRLNLVHDDTVEHEEVLARREANLAALQEIERLKAEPWAPKGLASTLQSQYQRRLDRLPIVKTGHQRHFPDKSDRLEAQRRLMRAVLNAEREAIVRLRDAGEISDEVLQTVSREIDLAETRPIRT